MVFRTWLLCTFLVAAPVVAVAEAAPADEDTTKSESSADAQQEKEAGIAASEAAEKERGPIYSLLRDKQGPIFGIKWGGQIFVDAPLNNEPEGAQVTLRRAEVLFWKTFNPNWSAKLTLQYNGGEFNLSDNYLVYSGWHTGTATIGIFDPSFSLESMSSTAGLTFMERALPVFALSENKSGGAGLLKRTKKSILSAGLFFFSPRQDDVRHSGQALVARYVHSPIDFMGSKAVHLGGSFSYRINAQQDQTEFKSRPEISVADDYYVNTGVIEGTDKVLRIGLEASAVMGRLSWQAEALSARVERKGYKNVTFRGAYANVSWFLTNDSRNYDAGTGEFQPVVPNHPLFRGGKGAFEIAARVSYVDLTDQDIIGGKESNISLGFNWYLNAHFRVMSNLIKVLDVNRPGSEYDGLDPLIFAVRLQWTLL